MKKLFAFFTNVVPRDGIYLTYSWHAPLNEASCDAAASVARKVQAESTRGSPASHAAWA